MQSISLRSFLFNLQFNIFILLITLNYISYHNYYFKELHSSLKISY